MLATSWLVTPRALTISRSRYLRVASSTDMAANGLMLPGELPSSLFLRQLFERESCTFTYLLADRTTGDAVLIDPVDVTADRDLAQIDGLGLRLNIALNTHVHADHITGTGAIKQKRPEMKSAISRASGAQADILLDDGDVVPFGGTSTLGLKALSTPGHTEGCMSFALCVEGRVVPAGAVFTGDALLIRGCGRTDFQGGSSEALFDSVHRNILSLDPHTSVFPAHDYHGRSSSTVGEELRLNPRLTRGKEEFIKIMRELQLAYPKHMDTAVPANMRCGLFEPAAADAAADEKAVDFR